MSDSGDHVDTLDEHFKRTVEKIKAEREMKTVMIISTLGVKEIPAISIKLSPDLQVGITTAWDRITRTGTISPEDIYEVLKRIMIEMDRSHRRKGYETKRLVRKLREAYEDIDYRPPSGS